jgi:hypothetical protein
MGEIMALSEEERKERHRAQVKAWREANPEKVKASSKAWSEANREKTALDKKVWNKANREKTALDKKVWNKANPKTVILSKLKEQGITDPPEELIELMVARRELKRNFKELNERIKEYDSNGTGIPREYRHTQRPEKIYGNREQKTRYGSYCSE